MMDMTRFQMIYRDVIPQNHEAIDQKMTRLAELCRQNSLEEEFCIERLMHHSDFKDMEILIRSIFDNVYATKLNRYSDIITKTAIQNELMKHHLQSRYQFRRNCITGGTEYIHTGTFVFDWKPLTKEIINRIALDAISMNIDIWDRDLRRYIESTYVEDYDPIMDYLQALPDWDGTDRIEAFARRVPTENADWPQDFHKWMLSMVSQWMRGGQLYGNTMVPLLIGGQGDGKSTFCRLILPEELRGYYTDRIDFTKRTDAERVLTRFALVNVDEFDSISKSQNAFLKHLLQKSDVMVRKLYETQTQQMKRYASFIATTNDSTPLTDVTGSRRFMCIQSKGTIDNTEEADYPQIYAQALAEIRSGRQTWFDRDDEKRIQRANAMFQLADNIEDVFAEMFRKPEREDKCQELSPMQILNLMHERYPSIFPDNSSAKKLGKMLVRKNFRFKASGGYRRYQVVFCSV